MKFSRQKVTIATGVAIIAIIAGFVIYSTTRNNQSPSVVPTVLPLNMSQSQKAATCTTVLKQYVASPPPNVSCSMAVDETNGDTRFYFTTPGNDQTLIIDTTTHQDMVVDKNGNPIKPKSNE